jgi:uncharacterized membrane protein YbaN (DUF454 family)
MTQINIFCVMLGIWCFSVSATTFSDVVVREVTYSTATIQWTLDSAGGELNNVPKI